MVEISKVILHKELKEDLVKCQNNFKQFKKGIKISLFICALIGKSGVGFEKTLK